MTIPLKHRPDGLGEFEPGDVVPYEHGGTNANSLLEAQNNLGINSKAEQASVDALQTDLENLTDEVETKADAIAVSQALALKADLVDGKVPASQLPSFVDDVLEGRYIDPSTFNDLSGNPYTPESGKVYVDVDTNKTYRWSGMLYVVIGGGGVALGETSSTAYRGDRGKAAYDHSQSTGNPHNATTDDINEGARKYFSTSLVRATDLTGLLTNNSADVVAADSLVVASGKFQAKWNVIDAYVRNSPLTGITFPNSPILVIDTVVLGIGKCQGQINDIRNPTWQNFTGLVNVTMHASIDQNGTRLEVCKINGMLWLRGWIRNTAIMPANTVLFSWNQATWLIDITGMGLSSPYRYVIGGQTITPLNDPNAQYYLTGEQQMGVTLNGLQFRINADIAANTFTVIPPFCLGKAS